MNSIYHIKRLNWHGWIGFFAYLVEIGKSRIVYKTKVEFYINK